MADWLRDNGLQIEEIYKCLRSLRDQHTEIGKALEDLQVKITTVASSSVSLSGSSNANTRMSSSSGSGVGTGVSEQQIRDLEKKIRALEHRKRKQLHRLDELKSEISVWLGVPLIKEEDDNKSSGNEGGFNRSQIGSVSFRTADEHGNASSIATGVAASNNERAKIQEQESKIAELSEIVEVYAAIVSQHDMEEKKRLEEKRSRYHRREEEGRPEVHGHDPTIYPVNSTTPDCGNNRQGPRKDGTAEEEQQLQREFKSLQVANASLAREKEELRQRVIQLETELLAASHWHRELTEHLLPGGVGAGDPASIKAALRQSLGGSKAAPDRIRAKIIAPTAWSNLLEEKSNPGPRPTWTQSGSVVKPSTSPSVVSTTTTAAATPPSSIHPLFSALRTLSPLHMPHHPSPQERRLLKRIEFYERKLGELEEYEIDRQRRFDEMENVRAELFTSMNEELVRRKATIQRLSVEREESRDVVSRGHSVARAAGRDMATMTSEVMTPPAARSKEGGGGYEEEEEGKKRLEDTILHLTSPLCEEERAARRLIEEEGVASGVSLCADFVRGMMDAALERRGGGSAQQEEAQEMMMMMMKKQEDAADGSDENEEEWKKSALGEKRQYAADVLLQLYGGCLRAYRKMISSEVAKRNIVLNNNNNNNSDADDTKDEEEEMKAVLQAIGKLKGREENTASI